MAIEFDEATGEQLSVKEIAASAWHLYARRSDGAIFVSDSSSGGHFSIWRRVPNVPGCFQDEPAPARETAEVVE